MSTALCPKIGQTIKLQGKMSSPVASFLHIDVKRCNYTVDPNCVNDTIYADIEASVGDFMIFVPFVNTIINPGNKEFKKYYLED